MRTWLKADCSTQRLEATVSRLQAELQDLRGKISEMETAEKPKSKEKNVRASDRMAKPAASLAKTKKADKINGNVKGNGNRKVLKKPVKKD